MHNEQAQDVEVPTNLEMGETQGLPWNRYRLIGVQPEGSYFGEHTCLLGEKRVATVVAVTFSELNSLSRLSLEKMASQWPELIDEILLLLDRCCPTATFAVSNATRYQHIVRHVGDHVWLGCSTALEYIKAAEEASKHGVGSANSITLETASSSIPLQSICAAHRPATSNLKYVTARRDDADVHSFTCTLSLACSASCAHRSLGMLSRLVDFPRNPLFALLAEP